MILASKLRLLTTLTAKQLTEAVQHSGYRKAYFDTAQFIGMSNGEEFIYITTSAQELQPRKVYVRNKEDDRFSASL